MEGLKGYIYIESYKQQYVKQAIEDIGNLRIGKWQQLMVPIREMTDVMRVVKDSTALKRGSWVRIKRSMYKDDIAQVSLFVNFLLLNILTFYLKSIRAGMNHGIETEVPFICGY